MTTLHRRIASTAHSIPRKGIRWDKYIVAFGLTTIFGFGLLGGYTYGIFSIPDRAFLQSELTRVYGDSNRWQSAYAALQGQVDTIDDSSFRTGWYNACVEFGGGSEQECYAWAGEVER
jgi:hypothetical protein